ncbi:DUF6516 family protein [Neorhizobium sp. BETTINA12A]|uniref:toxin-antitoxin system TumE family protein n=1 Tax=unclassified Neorhizobium TaxID=2629175 RepID=UPI001FF2F237|nr:MULTISPECIES: DUF6516 family protein [unclassified Neorhizobium]MCJ9672175.1 DUF6516 family protein [Neorhizobium sp. SHOUNA12B]MCJ9745636.1 DUF6516 family protein [Neorhizobium sp. SHOUNA12A]MCJ9750440.1 DUF6516 family protein [Neorhizobium sp. BETTINA12A]
MKAELVIRERVVFGDGAILEIKVWRVPDHVPPSQHLLKYSLFYGRPGKRLVGYDNERGKGDHRHYGDREESYRFVSIEQLLADFRQDVETSRGEKI